MKASRQRFYKITKSNKQCRKCGTVLDRWERTQAPQRTEKSGEFYFLWWDKCPGCKTIYMDIKSKREFTEPIPKQSATLF